MRRTAVLVGSIALFSACEQTSPSVLAMSTPEPAQFLLAVPDSSFRLSNSQRAELSPLIDPDALERFLARVRPEHRSIVLSDLNELGSQRPIAFGPATTSIPDPEIRAAVQGIFRGGPKGGSTRP